MNLKKLLGASADEWEKMSDEELDKILSPHYVVTRPTIDQQREGREKKKTVRSKQSTQQDMDEILKMAGELGVKLDFNKKK